MPAFLPIFIQNKKRIKLILKETQKTIINNTMNNPSTPDKPKQAELTKEEVQQTKQLLDVYKVIEDMKRTEFSPEELENKKK
jgi:non-homologous end joining protein Ku